MSAREAVARVVNDLRDAADSGDRNELGKAASRSADTLGMLLERGVADPDGGTVTVSVELESEGKDWVFAATGSTPEEAERLLRETVDHHGFKGVLR